MIDWSGSGSGINTYSMLLTEHCKSLADTIELSFASPVFPAARP